MDSRVGPALAVLVRACARRPLLTVTVALVLAALSVGLTVRGLGFVTSPLRLLPQHARYVVLMKEYLRDFGELNDIVVAVAAPSPDVAKAYAVRLAAGIEREGVRSRITYRVDPAFFASRGLLYLSVSDLTRLRDRLFDYEEFVRTYAERPTLARLLEGLNQQMANAMALGFIDLGLASAGDSDLRFLEAVVGQIGASLDGRPGYSSPWAAAFALGRLDDPDAGWFFSSNRRFLFLLVEQQRQEGNFTDNRERIERIRAAIGKLGGEFPSVAAGVTGGPVISNDEMVTALADSSVATVLSIVLTIVLVLVVFRGVTRPLLMVAVLLVGLAWSMGLITLTIGHLSVFSVMFISLVVGLGIDYGIYFLFRYQEELGVGAGLDGALRRTATFTGPGIFLGATAAAGAFLVLFLTEFQGIREFGVVSGIAVLMSFLATVTLFPALLVLVDRRRPQAERGGAPVRADDLEARWLQRITAWRRTILAGAAVISGLALWGARDVSFNDNLLDLQARGVESVVWEERILATGGRSGVSAITTAGSLEELRRKQEALARLPSVSGVETLLRLVPDGQTEKIAIIRQLAPLVASVRVASPPPVDPASLPEPLRVLHRRVGIALEGAGGGEGRRSLERVRSQVEAILRAVAAADPGALSPALDRLQREIFRDFSDKLRSFQASLDPSPVAPADIPTALRQRYVGASGRYLIRIYPAVDTWQREGATRFVTEVRSVDGDVAGPPVTSYEATRLIRRGYLQGTLYALAFAAVVTAAVLRRAGGTLVALTPVVLGVLWTMGLMRVFGLQFNLANVWALPLILGTAAEYGLNIYARHLEGRATGGPTLPQSTVLAVVLNGLTTIVGFGSLMVARHQGIFGLGLLLTLGTVASLVASLVVLPTLLRRGR